MSDRFHAFLSEVGALSISSIATFFLLQIGLHSAAYASAAGGCGSGGGSPGRPVISVRDPRDGKSQKRPISRSTRFQNGAVWLKANVWEHLSR